MAIEVDAIYESGTLKLAEQLPLKEHQRVRVVIEERPTVVERTFGMLGWTGDLETLRRIAMDDENGLQQCP
jgi:predicted DNA-binding antitoxin AbrB/MazE fold protein